MAPRNLAAKEAVWQRTSAPKTVGSIPPALQFRLCQPLSPIHRHPQNLDHHSPPRTPSGGKDITGGISSFLIRVWAVESREAVIVGPKKISPYEHGHFEKQGKRDSQKALPLSPYLSTKTHTPPPRYPPSFVYFLSPSVLPWPCNSLSTTT